MYKTYPLQANASTSVQQRRPSPGPENLSLVQTAALWRSHLRRSLKRAVSWKPLVQHRGAGGNGMLVFGKKSPIGGEGKQFVQLKADIYRHCIKPAAHRSPLSDLFWGHFVTINKKLYLSHSREQETRERHWYIIFIILHKVRSWLRSCTHAGGCPINKKKNTNYYYYFSMIWPDIHTLPQISVTENKGFWKLWT